jgi:predicted kinase
MKQIVIVSGAPGAGKTTLAGPLAEALGYPLISKDYLKETLARVLGGGDDLQATRRLGAAAMETMWMLAEHTPHAVLEANFRPRSEYECAKLVGLNARIVEVYCDCGPEEARRRFAERAAKATHDHSAHPLTVLSSELLAEYDRPVGIGKLLRVDTRDDVDVASLASSVGRCLADQGS